MCNFYTLPTLDCLVDIYYIPIFSFRHNHNRNHSLLSHNYKTIIYLSAGHQYGMRCAFPVRQFYLTVYTHTIWLLKYIRIA